MKQLLQYVAGSLAAQILWRFFGGSADTVMWVGFAAVGTLFLWKNWRDLLFLIRRRR